MSKRTVEKQSVKSLDEIMADFLIYVDEKLAGDTY